MSAVELPGWRHIYSGKVRDLYAPVPPSGAAPGTTARGTTAPGTTARGTTAPGTTIPNDVLLVVASDRISAFDHILGTEIPDKGRILTQLSLWWFDQLQVAHHVVGSTAADGIPAQVEGRAMICKKLNMFPVECIARGYLTGSGLLEYKQSQTVCSLPLPPGLLDGSRLERPIFTPSAKAKVGEHDENITFGAVAAAVGAENAEALRDLTLAIYSRAEDIARERGIILADTKVEFGLDAASGAITLGDEVLTPDSSRFWAAAQWKPGKAQPSFDKQYVRDWLSGPESDWDRSTDAPPPQLPAAVVDQTRARYVEAYEKLTGRMFA